MGNAPLKQVQDFTDRVFYESFPVRGRACRLKTGVGEECEPC